jgi:hypothetical protein
VWFFKIACASKKPRSKQHFFLIIYYIRLEFKAESIFQYGIRLKFNDEARDKEPLAGTTCPPL